MPKGTPHDLNDSVTRVRQALEEAACEARILQLQASARSVAEAAAAIGCDEAQIAKSIIFRGQTTGRSILAVASGVNRVSVETLQGVLGELPGKADADYVRTRTGFAIGGVAPIAHIEAPRVVVDLDLMQFDWVWAAAGHPRVVMRLAPGELLRITGATLAAVA